MKKLYEGSKILWGLFFILCFYHKNLICMDMPQEDSDSIYEPYGTVDDFAKDFINGESRAQKILDFFHKSSHEEQKAFALKLLPKFFILSSHSPRKVFHTVTSLDQVLLILIFKYLKKNECIASVHEILRLEHLEYLMDVWWKFNDTERDYLERVFGF